MSNSTSGPQETPIIIEISPEIVQNKNKRTGIVKHIYTTVCGLLNSHQGGILKLTSSNSLTPSLLDELVRGIEQTLIELVGLIGLREYCQTEIIGLGKEIIFTDKPSDRIFTIEYNLVLPTDFLVKQVLRTEPLEKIARVIKPGRPFANTMLHNYFKKFEKESMMPEDLRESDTVQFKKVKSDKNKNKSLADRIIANKITHYIAAFANHQGGHVYIGIDDETYTVCGQVMIEGERQRIVEKIASAAENMVWPEEHGKPELGKHWDISFLPMLDSITKEAIPDLFVIVVAIACCPGGVFLSHPEAYEYNDGKIEWMNFIRWKKRLLHDAHMRDIVKFCREQSGMNVSMCKIAEVERTDSTASKQYTASAASDYAYISAPFVFPKVSFPNTKSRTCCSGITDNMERLIQNGSFGKLQSFASKICPKSKVSPGADVEVTVRFMLALGAYLRRKFVEAHNELEKASSLITFTRNANEFQLQRLHLLACFFRGEGEYAKSYKVTYDAFQEIEGVSSSRLTAWVFNDAGNVFSIMSGEERNEEIRESLKQQAISFYTKAIDHTLAIDEKRNEPDQCSVMKSNLLCRCHLRRATLFLGCKLIAEDDDDYQNGYRGRHWCRNAEHTFGTREKNQRKLSHTRQPLLFEFG